MKLGLQISRFHWPGGPLQTAETLASVARAADDAGFASIWLMDHLFQISSIGKAEEPMLEAYTTLGFLAAHLTRGTPVVHASKGLEYPSLSRLSEVIAQELGRDPSRVAALSGPTHAEEVGRGLPTAAVVACLDASVAQVFRDLLHGPTFRVYTSSDIVGVELCGALKNVIALATGASDGLGYGDNSRAALITRSLVEIGRLVQAAGGDARSVAGLAGLGDVVVTCTSSHSRNRWAGEQIGRGRIPAEIVASTPKVIEGIPATLAAVELGRRYGVDLPVCMQVDQVINHGAPVREILSRLMARDATVELPSP